MSGVNNWRGWVFIYFFYMFDCFIRVIKDIDRLILIGYMLFY